MAIDWSAVATAAENAAKAQINVDWGVISTGVGPQLQALVTVGTSIEEAMTADPPTLTPPQCQSLVTSTKRALDGVLQAYEAIGIVVAEQAAAAAAGAVVSALKTAYPILGFLTV